jgi:hypothetical protein
LVLCITGKLTGMITGAIAGPVALGLLVGRKYCWYEIPISNGSDS